MRLAILCLQVPIAAAQIVLAWRLKKIRVVLVSRGLWG